jgi:hypothetical protein
MKYLILAVFVLTMSAHYLCAEEIENVEQSELQNQAPDFEKDASLKTDQSNEENVDLDVIITQAINFSDAIGDWFDDLFDKKQNMTFAAHIDSLATIIDNMKAAIVTPLIADKNNNLIALAAYNLTALLYSRAKETYEVLNNNRGSTSVIKIGNALKKVEKKFKSEQEKNKLKNSFKELNALLVEFNPALSKKVKQLELVVADNSTRTKKKGWWTLMWGLRHRLKAK